MSQELHTAPDEPASGRVTADRKGLHSRRALVAGVVGAGVGAAAATVFAGAQPAWAEGENVTVGGSFPDATSTTSISTSSGTGLAGTTSDSSGAGVSGLDTSSGGGIGVGGGSTHGIGVSGSSTHGTGVQGMTSGNGQNAVAGEDTSSGGGAGVSGSSTNGTGVSGSSTNSTGVQGSTSGTGQAGVLGEDTSPGGGVGVSGGSTNGIGVQAASSGGTALAVTGKVTFSSSGTVTVAAGKKSVTVRQSGLTPSSFVLATLQRVQSGVTLAAAVPGTGSLTIHLTSAATASLPVAWFVIG